ncbi:hypothetical protein M422DRAFT_234445 [Sphaerobolus stellatus SS14]|uniref:protein-tyrosine-phosphatase n=1 Tax=Sphaerobolus stellatus (strain SS14) TaxID=990650 RepID=A0A0C9URG9_SPHS4|nr:hypothetical protein M422DRAFT_234445 [Sphaerobolus stellatus SS14]
MPKRQKPSTIPYVHSSDSVSLILAPGLFLGPCSAASSKPFLTANAITDVLSVGSTPAQKIDGITYHRLSLTDSPSSSIAKVSDEACRIIDSKKIGKAKEGKILVHCSAGISRSPTLVVAYLMKAHNMSLKAALGRVVRVRPQVSPNAGFLGQLKELEEEIHGRVSLDVEELPKREKDQLALFSEDEKLDIAEEKEKGELPDPEDSDAASHLVGGEYVEAQTKTDVNNTG